MGRAVGAAQPQAAPHTPSLAAKARRNWALFPCMELGGGQCWVEETPRGQQCQEQPLAPELALGELPPRSSQNRPRVLPVVSYRCQRHETSRAVELPPPPSLS